MDGVLFHVASSSPLRGGSHLASVIKRSLAGNALAIRGTRLARQTRTCRMYLIVRFSLQERLKLVICSSLKMGLRAVYGVNPHDYLL